MLPYNLSHLDDTPMVRRLRKTESIWRTNQAESTCEFRCMSSSTLEQIGKKEKERRMNRRKREAQHVIQ